MNVTKFNTNPNNRLLWLVLVGYFVVCTYFTLWTYHRQIALSEQSALVRLEGIVKAMAFQIDGDAHRELSNRFQEKDAIQYFIQDKDYNQIHQVLKLNYEANSLKSPTYTMIFNNNSNHFEFIATSSDAPYYRHTYDSFNPILKDNYTEGGVIPQYSDRLGVWLSAFAPLRDRADKTVGIVMADIDFSQFICQAQSAALKNLLISLCIILPVILLLFFSLRRLVFREDKLKKKLENAYQTNLAISEKLEKSNRELTDFACIASHDLKAPIRSILSFAQLFERRNKSKFDDTDREYFNYIKSNAKQSAQLIEDLLSYSKIDKDLGVPTEVDINKCLVIVEMNMQSLIREKNALICYENLPILRGHASLITQLFQNFINNGIKYNESTQPIITISTQQNAQGEYIYAIKDNGIGIAPENQDKVFGMFQRLHSQTDYDGTGIGLSFCTRIVETYGGKIWLESTSGKGTTFYFTLPKAEVMEKKMVKELELMNT